MGAVRYLTVNSGGGILDPTILCTKTGPSVVDVLQEKHPTTREPSNVALTLYASVPPF